MKKVLTLFLAICMLISIIPMAVSAETINPESAAKNTLYVSTNKTFEGTANGSYDKPYKYFDEAYNTVTQDTTIVLLDDVLLSANNTKRDFFLHNLENDPVVAVCGTWIEVADGEYRYSALDLTNTVLDTCVLTLGTNMVFYDMNIKLDALGKNVWICAAYHDVTFGFNFNNVDLVSNIVSFTGADFGDNTNNNAKPDEYIDANRDTVANVYSGNFDAFYVGTRNKDKGTATTYDCTLNFYSGTVNILWPYVASDKSTGEGIMNIYGSKSDITTINLKAAAGTKNGQTTFNFYNGCTEDNNQFDPTITEAQFEARAKAVNYYSVNDAVYSMPSYAGAYVGVQNTEKYTATPENQEAYEAYSVRFVGVVNSLSYDEVGFKITCGERNFDTACSRVYTSIAGDGDDYTAAALGGNYIFAVAIKNIPTDGKVTFTVKPYFVVDNQTYYGTAYTVTYNAEGYVSSAVAN